MKRLLYALFGLCLLGGTMVLSGCASEGNPDDSQLPWSRPAKWEGGNSYVGAKTRN